MKLHVLSSSYKRIIIMIKGISLIMIIINNVQIFVQYKIDLKKKQTFILSDCFFDIQRSRIAIPFTE